MENNQQNNEIILPGEKVKIRYALLDELRGFLVLCMVIYHGLLSVYNILGLKTADTLFDFFTPAVPFFAGAFIMLSGMMCGYSHSNILRGLKCTALAIVVSVVTILGAEFMGRIDIRFGILHLLGFSMTFCGLFDFAFKKINKWAGVITAFALFIVLYGVPNDYTDFVGIRNIIPAEWYFKDNLFPFGITAPGFFSADYFPIIPWFFLFLTGYFLFKFRFAEKYSKIFIPKRIKPLGFLGRHALIIYILHQPVIYLICIPFTFN